MSNVSVSAANLTCLTGTVQLFVFTIPPSRGDIVGQLIQDNGTTVDLVQTQPLQVGSLRLSDVDGLRATI